jgi:hypothetical protein
MGYMYKILYIILLDMPKKITDVLFDRFAYLKTKESEEQTIDMTFVHTKLIKLLTKHTRTDVVEGKSCYENEINLYMYPICWFRTLMYILFLQPVIRNLLMSSIKIQHEDEDKHKNIKEVFVAAFEYFKRYQSDIQRRFTSYNKIYNFTYLDIDNAENNINIDDLWLYIIYCFSQNFSNVMEYIHVAPNYPDTLIRNFFNTVVPHIFPDVKVKYCPLGDFKITKQFNNSNLVVDINTESLGSSKVAPMNTHEILNNEILLVDYKNKIWQKLALYVKYNNEYYCLSGLNVTDWIYTFPINISGHVFPLYRCSDRYYSPEGKRVNGLLTISDIDLVERLIKGKDNAILPSAIADMFDNKYSKLRFNPNKTIMRIGIYTKDQLTLSPQELVHLEELYNLLYKTKTNMKRCISILSYFLSDVTFTVDNIKYMIKTDTDFLKKKKLKWTLTTDKTQGIKTEIKTEINIEIDWTSLKALYYFEGEDKVPSNDYIGFIQHIEKLQMTIPETFTTFEITNDIIRNAAHYYIFQNLIINNKLPSQRGGNMIKERNHIRYKKMTYKVRKDKHGTKYILFNKGKVCLKDIKGQYRYV